jgi:hypothetical protein
LHEKVFGVEIPLDFAGGLERKAISNSWVMNELET